MRKVLFELARIVPECNGRCDFCDFAKMLQNLINFLTFKLALPLATIAIIVGGFFWMFSGGIKKG